MQFFPRSATMASSGSILIVEDEWVVARDMQRCLQDAGYRVTGLVSSPAEALEQIDADTPDLVLIDIVLGPHDGMELAERLQERDLPFVYVTAHTDPDTLTRAKETGPLGYVVKPFDDRQLRSTIELALHAAEQRRKAGESAEEPVERARVAALEQGMQKIAELVKELGLVAPDVIHHRPEVEAILAQLSARERQIVELLLASRRVPGIAGALGISPHTVRNHLKAVFRKLGVHSQEELLELLRNASEPHRQAPEPTA
jgi:DNA-binding NarL/FixJ family response regulator